MAVYQKAYICPYRNNSPVLGEKFYVPFNPSEITIEEAIGVSESEENGLAGILGELGLGNMTDWIYPVNTSSSRERKSRLTLSVTLFFNTLTSLYQKSYEDVRTYIRQLYPFTNKMAKSKSDVEQIYFFWGSIAVAGTLNRMNVRYTMFAPDGKPVRAQVDISIIGDYVGEKPPGKAATQGSGEVTGLANDDTAFWSGVDPSIWRSLYNGMENPRL